MTVRRVLWFQALIAVSLILMLRCISLVQHPSMLYNLMEFLGVLLALYSIYLFPIIALVGLIHREPSEQPELAITWSLLAGVVLYGISLSIVLPMAV